MPVDYNARRQCTLCGQIWQIMTAPVGHNPQHTEAEWEAWRIQQGVPDGQPYARFVDPDAAPTPPDPVGPDQETEK